MYFYKDDETTNVSVIRQKYNFLCYSEVMKRCGISLKQLYEFIKILKIEPQNILRLPSKTYINYLTQEDFTKIKEYAEINYKHDTIPPNYISKKDFADMFGIKIHTVNNMASYFSDFNTYAKYFFVENIKTKFFYIDDATYSFYKERIDKYTTPYSIRIKLKHKLISYNNLREYAEGNLHKIAFDYEILAEIFDTASRHFKRLIGVYKKYAKRQIANSEFMDKHHIVPRFYEGYPRIDDLENTVYLSKEIHLLVHLLEYRCAYPDYKAKFFSSFCILSGRTNYKNINDNAFNEIENSLCNALDIE